MKVAIVCDWLTGIGGAERVVLELHRLYPQAPIYTSQYNPSKLPWFRDADVRTGWLQSVPATFRKFLPIFRILYFSRLNLTKYDLIISSSGAEAKGVHKQTGAVHICYMHAPTHYYWSRYESYLQNPGFPRGTNWLAKLGLRLLVAPLRRWDFRAAQAPDIVVANSTHTQTAIKKYYRRNSVRIFPPVDTKRFSEGSSEPRRGFVIAGRQTPYKRIDLAVQACTQLNVPLTVIGDGPQHSKLVSMAGPTITFLTDITDKQIPPYFHLALGFIFPGLDDFGITPVEAMACGTPVIAFKDGGALDYIVPNKTGLFFERQSVASLVDALQKFTSVKFDHAAIIKHAAKFNVERFRKEFKQVVNEEKRA